MPTNVVMPQLGESVVEGTVGKWLKNVGDAIAQYEPIMEVITDKVTTEVPAPAAGTLLQILVPEGTTVKAGTVVALIGQADEAPPPSTAKAPTHPVTQSTVSTSQAAPADGSARNRLTPVVARMIAEYNISDAELKTIPGTGENGRISKKDIENFIKRRETKPSAPAVETLPAWEQPGTGELFRPTEEVFGKRPSPPAPLPTGEESMSASRPPLPTGEESMSASRPPFLTEEESMSASRPPLPLGEGSGVRDDQIIPLSPMRRAIAEHMVRSKTVAPHVTTVHEADMSRVLAHYAKHQDEFARQGVKLTYTPYFIQAVVYGLQQVPLVNAQFSEQGIVMKRDLNIGIAVAVDEGLLVPIIKHADDKSLLGLARAVNDLAERARTKKLQPDDMTGGTFTITNYGVFGSLFGTPVISQPQSAILGVGAIQKRVVVINDAIAIRPMVYLALTFDHRLLDGAIGDTFMNKVKQYLETYPE
jgi:2-oxoisovalerate dehydrogenase E2 component (dihydrolipoyl transacylase)